MNTRNVGSFVIALALATLFYANAGLATAQTPGEEIVETCPDGVLPPTSDGSYLKITAPCRVEAGTYKLGDVHVLENGVLTFDDAKIDFWASNILIENNGSLVAGSPEAPIGTNGGLLTIHLWGKDQTNIASKSEAQGVPCWSDTKAQCGIPDAIWSSNRDKMGMEVPVANARKISALGAVAAQYPRANDDPSEPGYIDVKNDYFYSYTPLNFDGAVDPKWGAGYFGYKVLAVSYGGTLKLFGKKGATYATPACGPAPTTSGTSWARLNSSVKIGDKKLIVDRPMTLQKGDQIVVTTTDYLPGNSEQMTVAADVTCDSTITTEESFAHAHVGTRFSLAVVPASVGLNAQLKAQGAETRAAVGVLTRSIRIVSAGDTMNDDFPAAPPPNSPDTGYYFGGHTIVRQGFKVFQVQGVEYSEMGQGGRIGHYPVHFHHVRSAPANSFVRDSSINHSMTRWIVLHGAQNIELSRNVGYKSIGHGFYLEDGTEINNTLTANLGVFARGAVDNVQNPRKVPGILAAPDLHTTIGEQVPYRSDYDHPSVFWIMNGWNDFKDNMAAGAGTCGMCYWLLPGANSGMSRNMKWTSYASMQSDLGRAGLTPLKSFVGNMCTAAMTSFIVIGSTEPCLGVGPGGVAGPHPLDLLPIKNPLAPPSVPPPGSDADGVAKAVAAAAAYYPMIGSYRFPTLCTADDCSVVPPCAAGNLQNCSVTVLDHYTTSFNWAAFGFAAIWLRSQWYLVNNSVISDVQNAGLTMVTGGGYTASDVVPGHWALVQKSVFIGNTQDNNPFASNGGPFNPQGLKCALRADGVRENNFCLSVDEGISFQTSNFGMYQRLFSVYDGPAYQGSNAYLNITKRTIDDCKPVVDVPNKVGRCDKPGAMQSEWLSGNALGLQKALGTDGQPYCYMPNAAIGWKQPNGFYYPPAFHSENLFFDNVDIRHFVLTPLVKPGTLETDFTEVAKQYCIYNSDVFKGFAGNDRQTVLNDDDGSLTGYRATTVINKDDFFAAPVDATQCLSDDSSRTSPYQYVSTVVYPQCALDKTCALPPNFDKDGNSTPGVPNWNSGDWNRACTTERCYGIPLWRQDRMPIADKDPVTGKEVPKSIRMMGQETGQRGSLTVNHGTYYFDTSLSKATQETDGCSTRDNPAAPCVVNVFKAKETYYLFLIFAKKDTAQTYRFFVGDNTDFDPASIHMVRADIAPSDPVFTDLGGMPIGDAYWLGHDKATAKGVVEVSLKLADFPSVDSLFAQGKKEKCQPASYCKWDDGTSQCLGVKRNPDGSSEDDAVCKWTQVDQDCPSGGCFGIKFTLPSGFKTRDANDRDPTPNPRPAATCLAKAAPWDVSLESLATPDGQCPKPSDSAPLDFCAQASAKGAVRSDTPRGDLPASLQQ